MTVKVFEQKKMYVFHNFIFTCYEQKKMCFNSKSNLSLKLRRKTKYNLKCIRIGRVPKHTRSNVFFPRLATFYIICGLQARSRFSPQLQHIITIKNSFDSKHVLHLYAKRAIELQKCSLNRWNLIGFKSLFGAGCITQLNVDFEPKNQQIKKNLADFINVSFQMTDDDEEEHLQCFSSRLVN